VSRRIGIVSILGILALLLSLVPAYAAVTDQDNVFFVTDSGSNIGTTVTAATAVGGSNVVTLRVNDADLDSAASLTGAFEILGVADGSTKTFDTDNSPIDTVSSAFDLQDGIAYFTAVSVDRSKVTLNEARAADFATISTFSVTDVSADAATTLTQTGDDALSQSAKITAVKVSVTDKATTDTDSSVIVVEIAGTSVNASTLAETASDTETVTVTATTGATATGTTSKFWKDDVVATIKAASTTGADGFTVSFIEARVIGAVYTYNEADTTDDSDGDEQVAMTSSSDTTGIDLTLTETGPATAIFTAEAALISEANLDTITQYISDNGITTTATTVLAITTGVEALTGDNEDAGDDAGEWITDTVAALTDITSTSTAAALLAITIEVAHDDTLTATYTVPTPDATATATVDMEAPVLSGISPAKDVYTNDETPTFTVTMVDADSGIDTATLVVTIDSTAVSSPSAYLDPVTDGYSWTFVGQTIADSSTSWVVTVGDDVGNSVTTTTAFTVDTTDPGFVGASTGTGIQLDTSTTSDADDYKEFASADWVRLEFNEGILESSVTAADFTVGGSAPTAFLMSDDINSVSNDLYYVYVNVSTQAADATPTVKVATAITDLAGNSEVDTTGKTAVDGINPTITASLSATLGDSADVITLTVSTDESLVRAPTVALSDSSTMTMSAVSGTTNTWTGTDTIATSVAITATVSVEDTAGNTASDDDSVYEGDIADPTASITALGETSDTVPEVEEGAVWVISTFVEESEYTGDTHKTVTVTAATLDDVDVSGELFTSDNKVFTLAKTLTTGTYDFSITAADDAGNDVTAEHEFEVVARAAFSITLLPGMNLVSLPGTATSSAINDIIATTDPIDTVIKYVAANEGTGTSPFLSATRDATTSLFTSTDGLTTLDAGAAYWMNATATVTLDVDIPQRGAGTVLPPIVNLLAGYNAVGIWDIASETSMDPDAYFSSVNWKAAYWYDPTPGAGWTVMRPDGDLDNDTALAGGDLKAGRGYYVYLEADDTLVP
jgi:hypothetical protein